MTPGPPEGNPRPPPVNAVAGASIRAWMRGNIQATGIGIDPPMNG